MCSAAIRRKKIPGKYRTYFHHLGLGTKPHCNNIANYNFTIISTDSLFFSPLQHGEGLQCPVGFNVVDLLHTRS